ncbi:MAG: DUF2807 domain-containing protein [Algoriphagus sp.]|nr:DUF2807 domain-containing protein [Algoriphagus sp.]
MKSHPFNFAFLVALIFLMGACTISTDKSTKGDDLATEDRSISEFSQLSVHGVFNLYLSQGDKESLRIEADEQTMDKIIIKNVGEKLIIELEEGVELFDREQINIYLTIKDIDSFEFEGVGNIKTEEVLRLNDLDLKGDGVGNTKLELEADRIDAEFNIVGNVTLSGKVETIDLKNNGLGNVDASDLKTQYMTLNSNGIGNVEVYCEKEISITANGIGKVTYSGDPEVKKLDRSGIGKVEKK